MVVWWMHTPIQIKRKKKILLISYLKWIGRLHLALAFAQRQKSSIECENIHIVPLISPRTPNEKEITLWKTKKRESNHTRRACERRRREIERAHHQLEKYCINERTCKWEAKKLRRVPRMKIKKKLAAFSAKSQLKRIPFSWNVRANFALVLRFDVTFAWLVTRVVISNGWYGVTARHVCDRKRTLFAHKSCQMKVKNRNALFGADTSWRLIHLAVGGCKASSP